MMVDNKKIYLKETNAEKDIGGQFHKFINRITKIKKLSDHYKLRFHFSDKMFLVLAPLFVSRKSLRKKMG